MKNNYLVIMAGGIGSRFWPMSTSQTPKQFLDILGTGQTMIQQTVNRHKGLVPDENIYVVTSGAYKQLINEQLPMLKDDQILMEPCMRNTAPCIAYASYKIKKANPKANIVVAPSDHLITDVTEYQRVVNQALAFTAENDSLITLGITPHRPETGYGYVEAFVKEKGILQVSSFQEKPDLATAMGYLAAGNYFWNAGIFVWSAESIVAAIEKHLPELAQQFEALLPHLGTELEQSMIDTHFPLCENISVDYGILERAENISVLPADFGWSDLGTWGSLWEKRSQDEAGNAIVGEGVKTFECRDTIVTVPQDRKYVLQGLEDYIVAEANGVVLICKKEEEQRIKEFSSMC